MKHIDLKPPCVSVCPKAERGLIVAERVASTRVTGEEIEIVRSITNPFNYQIRGEKLVGEINLEPVIQEAILHVLKGNA